MRARRGFALIAALWATVAAGVVVVAVNTRVHDALLAARNRASRTRAIWTARGCTELAFASFSEALWPDDATPRVTGDTWTFLDARVAAFPGPCETVLRPAGLTANLNALTPSALALLLRHAGEVALQADSLAAAVVDWRDADDDTVSLGAERAWYQQRGRPSPRNDAFGALEELHLVRGFERLTTFDTLFGVRAERILWTRAPSAVLRALPGMTDEALVVLAQRGRRSLDGLQFLVTLPELSKAARDTLSAHMPELVASLTSAPESWTVTATAASGRPAISVTIATTFTLAERRLIVLRQVITP